MNMHLNADQLAGLEQDLRTLRDALVNAQQNQLGGMSRAEHAREILLEISEDATQRDADREVDLARTDRGQVALSEIDGALQRIAAGRYGQCADCAEEIPLARLKLAPQALRCIACESLRERNRQKPPSM